MLFADRSQGRTFPIQFNESLIFSEAFCPNLIENFFRNSMETENLKKLEIEILGYLNYELSVTTPYSYIEPVLERLPSMKNFPSANIVIERYIDLAIT